MNNFLKTALGRLNVFVNIIGFLEIFKTADTTIRIHS